jgi:hypothetical protein
MPNPDSPFPPHITSHDEITVTVDENQFIDMYAWRRITVDFAAIEQRVMASLDIETNPPAQSFSTQPRRWTPIYLGTWDTAPSNTQQETESMFDIVVTSQHTHDVVTLYDSSAGWIMTAMSGQFNGHILLNIGANYFINLSKLDGLRYRVSDHNYMVRRLAPTEAITLIVTR